MYDDLPDEVGVFDFDEFADHLLDQGVLASPSALHGCLCGLLSAGAPEDPEYGLDAVEQALDVHLHGELASRSMQLYSVTATALEGEEFAFMPLLPADDEDIGVRTTALANWCEGFLTGFAYCIAAADTAGGALSQEAGEVLRDIAAMAQAEADAGENTDEAEGSFTELVEYLRVAVANIFLECSATGRDQRHSTERGRPLH